MKFKNVFVVPLFLFPFLAGALVPAHGAETNAVSGVSSNAVIFDTFDEWKWAPIQPDGPLAKSIKALLDAGQKPPLEYRGPLYRLPVGFSLPAGRMVEGAEAYQGRSMLLDASLGGLQVGYHDHYGHKIKPGGTYKYEVALKGKGQFNFQGWIGGVDPATGKDKWLDFPNWIAVKVTNVNWQVYEGSFTVKKYDDRLPYRVPDTVGAAIVINSNDVIYVDNFKISK